MVKRNNTLAKYKICELRVEIYERQHAWQSYYGALSGSDFDRLTAELRRREKLKGKSK